MKQPLEELPAKLDDIIHFSFNFDSLIKIIQFLHKSNTEMSASLYDLTRRVATMDQLESQVEQLTLKNKINEQTLLEVDHSLGNHSNKLLEIDGILNTVSRNSDDSKKKIEGYDKMLNAHEENINNLNRVVEDHLQTTKAQEEKITSMQQNLTDVTLKMDKNMNDVKKSLESEMKLNQTISNLSIEVNDLKEIFNLKTSDIDKTVGNLISTISDIASKTEGNGLGNLGAIIPQRRITAPNLNTFSNGGGASDHLFKMALDDIERLQKKIDENVKITKELQSKHKTDHDEIGAEISMLITRVDRIEARNTQQRMSIDDVLVTEHNEGGEGDGQNKGPGYDGNQNITEESMKDYGGLQSAYQKLSENLNIISTSLGDKVNREDMNAINHILLGKIELLSDKVNETMKGVESRLKKFQGPLDENTNGPSTGMADYEYFTQSLEKQMIEMINKTSLECLQKLILEGDLSHNPIISSIITNVHKHTDEMNEAFKSIVDIRSILVSNEIVEDVNDLKTRMELSEEDYRRLKYKFDELKRNLDEEDANEEIVSKPTTVIQPRTSITGGNTMKATMNYMTQMNKELSDKVAVLEKKHREMTLEIKESIKNSLKTETEKVIEQFQRNLMSFTNKFEYQLKNKIDQMGLSNFEYKMNNRLNTEMKDKLDKKDMKKNNHAINRKMDSLENKISKTLVDTIIDLQMDEAPLIVKKNNKNVEKCASCNQSLPQTNYIMTTENNILTTNTNASVSINKMRMSRMSNFKDKDKLPEIDLEKNI